MSIFTIPLDDETRRLLRDCQKSVLRRALEQLNASDFDPKDLGKHIAHYCNISRQVNAANRNAVMLETAKIRADAVKCAAQIRAEAAMKAPPSPRGRASSKAPGELDDPILEDAAAPHGRDDAGRPYSDDEFHTALSRSVKEIYGVDFDAAAVAKTAQPGYIYPPSSIDPDTERALGKPANRHDPSAAPEQSRPRQAPT